MKILVTGGAGYLGAVLVPHLLDMSHQVTVVDNFVHGVPSLLPWCLDPKLQIIRADARFHVAEMIAGFDAIIPLAAVVGAPACARCGIDALTINRDAVRAICRAATPEQIIVYPNTNSGYGSTGVAPCTEDTPINPLSLYAKTKAAAEAAVLVHPRGVALRFATLFGCSPRMRLDLLVNDFTYRAVRDRSLTLFERGFRRNYLHVHDAAGAIIFAIKHADEMKGRAFNAGLSTANLTKRQLCERIAAQVLGFIWHESTVGEDPDKRDYEVSNARIEALGWKTALSIDDGIAELIKAFRGMPFESYRNA